MVLLLVRTVLERVLLSIVVNHVQKQRILCPILGLLLSVERYWIGSSLSVLDRLNNYIEEN